jgi:hypothetical protein
VDELSVAGLMQVCWSIDDFETRRRKIKPLLTAMKKFKLKEGIVITQDYEHKEKINDKILRYIPIRR